MKKIKDLLYDTSDIFVAILILCCAIFVIAMRVDALMTYPEKMASEASERGGYIRSDLSDPGYTGPEESDASVQPDNGDSAGQPSDGDSGDQPENGEPVTYSLYIAYAQPMNEIADNLVRLGFFESRQDVFDSLESHNASQKVQAGTFLIPAGSTKDEVISIITGPANNQ